MKLTATIALLLMVLTNYSQKPVFRVENEEMILRLDRSWNKRTTDSILVLFDMAKLSVDSAWRFGSAGQLALDGWLVRKKGKNQLEVYKSTQGGRGFDLIGLPLSLDGGGKDSVMIGEPNTNSFDNLHFGFNDFKNTSVYALNDSLTVFRLDGFKKAKQVYLSGSFNNWSTQGFVMKRDEIGWVLPIPLAAGKHEYKFIVDGRWMGDPFNNQKTPDNAGDYNSVFFKTNYTFRLKGYPEARRVVVAGSFNNWSEGEPEMQRIGDSWVLDVFLPDGTFPYKFIVDNNWITDPANPDARPDGYGNINSFISLGTPVFIELSGYLNASEVYLAGSFNNWGQTGLSMNKTESGWTIPVVLRFGVYDYFFIADGKEVTDSTTPVRTYSIENKKLNFVVLQPNHIFELKNYPDAKSVFVTGNFCDWQEPGYPLEKKDGVWQLPFALPAGKVKYKYIVDGKWILDPANSRWEENEFGTGNSVLWINNE
ncbi:MAG: glycogen-binding domain-containing protein [Flavobacteriales bacterium]